MGAPRVNAKELVERLWRDVKGREQAEEMSAVPTLRKLDLTADDATLRDLNLMWDIAIPEAPAPANGSLRDKAKHRVASFVLGLLRPYFEEERHFRARLVQMLNTLSANEDALAGEIRELATALRLESRRLAERADLLHRLLENRLADLEGGADSPE
jgi:hypothetical protein